MYLSQLLKFVNWCGIPGIMSWHYRIVRYREGGYGLHEVYFNPDGTAWARTQGPATFGAYPEGDEPEEAGPSEIVRTLELALKDARERPVFDDPVVWAPRAEKPDEPLEFEDED